MENEKLITILNSLIEINNDRVEGYESASKETEDSDLKILFAHCIETSKTCKASLVHEVNILGGTPTEGTKTTGKLYRVWMDFKSLVTGKDRKAILDSCAYGEEAAMETYVDILKDNFETLTSEKKLMFQEQLLLIKVDYNQIIILKDELVPIN